MEGHKGGREGDLQFEIQKLKEIRKTVLANLTSR